MKNIKIKIACGIILIASMLPALFISFLFSKQELRDLGNLTHSCDESYKINITHFSEFENIQPLYFNIKKNDRMISDEYLHFENTNDMDLDLTDFEIHCFDKILYVTWRNENHPLIMFDTITNYFYYSNGKDLNHKEILYERIRKGNQKLRMD